MSTSILFLQQRSKDKASAIGQKKADTESTIASDLAALEEQIGRYNGLAPTSARQRVNALGMIQAYSAKIEQAMKPKYGIAGSSRKDAREEFQDLAQSALATKLSISNWPMIPAKIHIIHLGSTILTGKFASVRNNIIDFVNTDDHHEVILWYSARFLSDSENTALKNDAQARNYKLRSFMGVFENTTDDIERSLVEQVKYFLVRKTGTLNVAGQKIDGARNWGVLSDLMRVAILYRYGGIYFDTDMEPKRRIPTDFSAKYGILVNVKGAQMTPCNDIIASTAGNQFIEDYAEMITGTLEADANNLLQRLVNATLINPNLPKGPANHPVLRSPTIQTTGPSALKSAIQAREPSTKADAFFIDNRYAPFVPGAAATVVHDFSELRFPPRYVKDPGASAATWA